MIDASVTAQWIELLHCDDPRDVVHQTVASLAQGGVIGLATEIVYALAASALHAEGMARLRAGRMPDSQPLTLLVKGAQECTDWVPGISQVGRRLAWRLWPGPLTLVFPPGMTDGLFGRLLPRSGRSLRRRAGWPCAARPTLPARRAGTDARPRGAGDGWPCRQAAGDHGRLPARLTGLDMVIDSGPTVGGGIAPRCESTTSAGRSNAKG